MQWLLESDEPYGIELCGEWLMVWCKRVKPTELARVLDTLKGVVDHVPRVVYGLYGQPADVPSGVEANQHPAPTADAAAPPPNDTAPAIERVQWWRRRSVLVAGAVFVALYAVAWIVAGMQSHCDGCGWSPDATSRPTPTVSAPVGVPLTLVGLQPGERIAVTFRRLAVRPKSSAGGRGSRTVGVLLVIRNAGTIPYHDAPSNGASILDADGIRYPASLLELSLPELGVVSLSPGASATGDVWFDIPAGVRPVALLLTADSGFGPQTGRWRIRQRPPGGRSRWG